MDHIETGNNTLGQLVLIIEINMSKNNQHYVPQFYFRFFSADKKSICVLNKKNGNTYPSSPIRNQASRNKFYGNDDIENAFCEMEGHFSRILRKMGNCNSFKDVLADEYLLLLQSIVFQRTRTLASRNNMQPLNNELMRVELEVRINNDQNISEEEKRNLISALSKFEIDPLRPHLEQIANSLNNSHLISDLHPVFLENRTNRPFIFSDSPVVFHNAYYEKVTRNGVLGFSTPGLQVFYPLTCRRCLLLIDAKRYKVKRVVNNNTIYIKDINDISLINRLQILSATSSVYFSDYKHKDYVHYLWSLDEDKDYDNSAIIVEAPGFDQDGNSIGDIMHSYAPLLPIKLRLSFLHHLILGDEQYHFEERDFDFYD